MSNQNQANGLHPTVEFEIESVGRFVVGYAPTIREQDALRGKVQKIYGDTYWDLQREIEEIDLKILEKAEKTVYYGEGYPGDAPVPRAEDLTDEQKTEIDDLSKTLDCNEQRARNFLTRRISDMWFCAQLEMLAVQMPEGFKKNHLSPQAANEKQISEMTDSELFYKIRDAYNFEVAKRMEKKTVTASSSQSAISNVSKIPSGGSLDAKSSGFAAGSEESMASPQPIPAT